jgi:3-phosphoshikimate 1-carboxyvinyltransferase
VVLVCVDGLAFAPAALFIDKITINNPEVVSKSYQRYFEDLKKAGFIVEEVE